MVIWDGRGADVHLAGQRSVPLRVAVVGLVPFAELGGNDSVPPRMGQLGGKGALADAGRTHDPEEPGIKFRVLSPFFHRLKQPFASVKAFLQQLVNARVGLDGFEMAVERFYLAGKAAAFLALHHPDDLGELDLIPLLPRRLARGALILPFVHIEPLDVADVHRRLHLLLALYEDGLDVAALHADGESNLVEADAGVAGGVLREEGQHAAALQNTVGDGVPPIVAKLDLALIEPDIVAALFQVGLDALG